MILSTVPGMVTLGGSGIRVVSSFSSAILAGTQQSRRDEAKKAFDGAWSAVGQDLAELDKLASRWSAQADEDRLNGVKEQLPTLRAVQDKRDRPCGQRRKEMRG